MLVVVTLWSILSSGNCNQMSLIHPSEPMPHSNLAECIEGIMKKYFVDAQTLSYVNLGFQDDPLLDDIHWMETLSVSISKPKKNMVRSNRAYMIVARNEDEFSKRVDLIKSEGNWNPYVRFLIVLYTLREIKLEQVFNNILQLHINNIIVVNGTETAELYTYNPFENYACGKYYDRITEFGKCSNVESADLYPNKIITGLRNCFFNVSCPHWPPYSIEPTKSEDVPYVMGTEQYIFHLMSQIEHFKYNFTYNFDPEMFSLVSQDMPVTGPLAMLETNNTDVMLGGFMLTQARAKLFFYNYGHLDQIDEIRIIVKKASMTPAWKDFYLEFSPLVWASLLIVLVFYTTLVILLLKTEDKGHVILVLLDYLLLHGAKFNARQTVNIIVICWVWFAYLINCFYQSSLVSLTTKPSIEYQIHNEQSMRAHGLKACISQVMQQYLTGESFEVSIFNNNTEDKSCEKLITSIRTVGQSKDQFTISLYTIYLYYKEQLYDEYGNSLVYPFHNPFSKVIYAIFFHKGFPMGERLHELALRIREAGLSDKSLRDHYFLRNVKYHFHSHGLKSRFAIPWYVFIVGVFISIVTFLVEIAYVKKIEYSKRKTTTDLEAWSRERDKA